MIEFKELKIPNSSTEALTTTEWNGLVERVERLYFNISPNNLNLSIGEKVGIGTDDPTASLQIIDSNQDANGKTLIIGPTNQSNLRLGYHSSYSWIQSHGSKPLVINPLGNPVGIGTTNASFPLSLGPSLGKIKLALYQNASGSSYYGMGVTAGKFYFNIGNPQARYIFLDRAGDGAKEVLTIQGSGRVGIGTSSPSSILDVRGQLTIDNNGADRGWIIMKGAANNDKAKALLNGMGKNEMIFAGCWDDEVYFYWKDNSNRRRRATIKGTIW